MPLLLSIVVKMVAITIDEIQELIEPAISALGYELVGSEFHQQKGRALLRVYVDSKNGVSVGVCAKISRQIAALLEVEDPIAGGYDLEVSSPGLDRPLFTLAHFQQFVGHKIKIRLKFPREDRRHFIGSLSKVEGNQVTLIVDGNQSVMVEFNDIERANLVPEF